MAKPSASFNFGANKKAKVRAAAKQRHGNAMSKPRAKAHSSRWKAFREKIDQGGGSGE
jgi:hypothetical protein